MSDLKIIAPIDITDAMVGSSFTNEVLEGEYAEYSLSTTYAAGARVQVTDGFGLFGEPVGLGITTVVYGMTCSKNGDLYYANVDPTPDGIYMRAKDADDPADFLLVESSPTKNIWAGMTTSPSNNIYVSVNKDGSDVGDIYMQTGGSGTFASLSQSDREWMGMCASENGHVYCCVYGGDIYKQTSGAGNFAALTAGNKNWRAMAACPITDDIYACVYGGDIWVQSGEAGSFNQIADTDRNWYAMCATADGDIYAAVYGGDIYVRANGAGLFAATGNATRNWTALCYDPVTGDIYAAADDDIYVSRSGAVHKKFESLVGSNTGNWPPSDVLATTPKWNEISATNKWKVFDGVVNDQMSKVSPAVYQITPGVTFTGIACLNLEATSVRIQTSSSAYDQTVSTGANDVVKLDLAGTASDTITITITNSAGLAKCGEIVVGTVRTIGTLKPQPVVGITDYSVKTQDEWGNWSITERAYSEKMSCVASITYSSLDTVIGYLKTYRATPLVWVGNTSYSCLIIYGYVKDWSVPVESRGKAIMSLQIEGLT